MTTTRRQPSKPLRRPARKNTADKPDTADGRAQISGPTKSGICLSPRPSAPCIDCGVAVAQAGGKGRPKLRCDGCREADRLASKRSGGFIRSCIAGCGHPADRHRSYCSSCQDPPAPRRPVSQQACAECCGMFETSLSTAKFCSARCRTRAADRRYRRGHRMVWHEQPVVIRPRVSCVRLIGPSQLLAASCCASGGDLIVACVWCGQVMQRADWLVDDEARWCRACDLLLSFCDPAML